MRNAEKVISIAVARVISAHERITSRGNFLLIDLDVSSSRFRNDNESYRIREGERRSDITKLNAQMKLNSTLCFEDRSAELFSKITWTVDCSLYPTLNAISPAGSSICSILMETAAKNRRRLKATKRWREDEVSTLLREVRKNRGEFEVFLSITRRPSQFTRHSCIALQKPTARIFYNKIAQFEQTLKDYQWSEMRDKMRNLKTKYKHATDWRNNSRTWLQDECKERDFIQQLCPYFSVLEEIYGTRQEINQPLKQSDDPSSEAPKSFREERNFDKNSDDNKSVDQCSNSKEASRAPKTQVSSLNLQGFIVGNEKFMQQLCKKQIGQYKPLSGAILAQQDELQEERLQLNQETLSKGSEVTERRMNLEKQKLAFELKNLELQKLKLTEEMRLKREEIKNNFVLEKMKIENELQLKKYELEIIYQKYLK